MTSCHMYNRYDVPSDKIDFHQLHLDTLSRVVGYTGQQFKLYSQEVSYHKGAAVQPNSPD